MTFKGLYGEDIDLCLFYAIENHPLPKKPHKYKNAGFSIILQRKLKWKFKFYPEEMGFEKFLDRYIDI